MTGSKLNKTQTILCLKETNLMHNLSGVYFIKRLYMFGRIHRLSSGGTPYVYKNWYLLSLQMAVCCRGCSMFRAYPPPIIRRHTICLQKLVLIVSLDGCLLSWVFHVSGVSTTHHQEAHRMFTKLIFIVSLDGCLLLWVFQPSQDNRQPAKKTTSTLVNIRCAS